MLYSPGLFPFISVLFAAVRLILQSYMGGSSLGKHEKLQGLERVKGSRSGECSKRVADLVGDRIEGVGSCRAMEEGDR